MENSPRDGVGRDEGRGQGEHPQCPYTKVPNAMLDALSTVGIGLSLYERCVVNHVIRRTYGWNRREDTTSYSQFSEATGIERRNVHRIVKQLEARGILKVRKSGQQKVYSMEEDMSKWGIPVDSRVPATSEREPSSPETTGPGQQLSFVETMAPSSLGTTQVSSPETHTKEKRKTTKKSDPEGQGSTLANTQVRTVFAALRERRGYNSSTAAGEAKAIRWMLRQGYTEQQIVACYDDLKAQPFWQAKPLYMMSVQKQIGEWRRSKVLGDNEDIARKFAKEGR